LFDSSHIAGRSTSCDSTSQCQAAFSNGTQNLKRLGTITNSYGSGTTSGARGVYTSFGNSPTRNFVTGYSRVAINSTTEYTDAFYDYYNGISWTAMTDLKTLGTDNTSCGNGINSSIYIVGFSGSDTNGHCEIETDTVTNQKAWYSTDQATLTQITNTLGGTDAAAWAINNSNVVTGWADYKDPATGNLFKHAFTYTINVSTSMTDLGVATGYNTSWAQAINTNGDVAGFVCTAGHCGLPGDTDNARHAMLKTSGGTMTALGTLGGNSSEAKGINASGVVVGSSETGRAGDQHAFVYYDSTTGMQDLQGLVDDLTHGKFLFDARAIDDNGDIVGAGAYDDGTFHIYLLTPDSPHVSGFGGKRMDKPAIAPDGLPTAEKPAVAQLVTSADNPAPLALTQVQDPLGVKEKSVPKRDWWEWDGGDFM
jgi:probable HAF family extracellular repeat protein